ncbi:CDT1-like protein a, chloroplastic [Linum perenne]
MTSEKKTHSTRFSSSSSTPSKSLKPPLHPKSTPKSKQPAIPFATQTPDQSSSAAAPVRRLRNRNVALNLTELKRAATSEPPKSAAESVRRRIFSWPDAPSPAVPKQAGSGGDGSPKLPEKRFSYRNLAQLKYILPEAIEITTMMKFDEQTSCMKPDLHISLDPDAIEFDKKTKSREGKHSSLRKVFCKRLEKFCESHPKGDEVPEAMLPEPFNYIKPNKASHLPSFFRRSLSRKGEMGGRTVGNASISVPASESCLESDGEPGLLVAGATAPCIPQTPLKVEGSSLQSTPAKDVLSPSNLMSVTPVQSKQKRSLTISPDYAANSLPTKLVRRLVVEDDGELPEILLESIREKQRKAEEENDPAISQAKRRLKMIASSPKLFNTIHFLFQSIGRSVMTKEELIHKIIAGQSDIADRREVEERLSLLEVLLPEWISEKKALSGDLLCCINKSASVEAMRERLEEAI